MVICPNCNHEFKIKRKIKTATEILDECSKLQQRMKILRSKQNKITDSIPINKDLDVHEYNKLIKQQYPEKWSKLDNILDKISKLSKKESILMDTFVNKLKKETTDQ